MWKWKRNEFRGKIMVQKGKSNRFWSVCKDRIRSALSDWKHCQKIVENKAQSRKIKDSNDIKLKVFYYAKKKLL
jgi:hypothetical protein